MEINYNWVFNPLESYPTASGYNDVVFNVHWDCLGSQEYSGSTYNGRVYGCKGVSIHSGSAFIPYNDLTQDEVLSWVWNSMGEEQKLAYESAVQTQINNLINPPVVQLPLPWATTGSLS